MNSSLDLVEWPIVKISATAVAYRMLKAMDPDRLVLGPLWYIAFLFSTTCHEAAHALAAKLGGDLTAFHGGQVSLNPIPHIRREPFGTVIIPILSFLMGGAMIGWASAPYDPGWRRRYPKRAAWMSLAGPAANFAIVILAALLIRLGIATGFFSIPGSVNFTHVVGHSGSPESEALATLLSIFFSLNVLLGCFNLLPVPPLDGYGVLGIFTSEAGAIRLANWEHSFRVYSYLGILIGWQLFNYLYSPVFSTALTLLYPGAQYR
jgi:Zn-dependent protease